MLSILMLIKEHDVAINWSKVLIIGWRSKATSLKGDATCINHFLTFPVLELDIFQTGVTSIGWWRWFMETGQIITVSVTGQIHDWLYYSRAALENTKLLSLSRTHVHAHTHIHLQAHTPHAFHHWSALFQKNHLRTGQTNNSLRLWPIADLPLVYADFNQ